MWKVMEKYPWHPFYSNFGGIDTWYLGTEEKWESTGEKGNFGYLRQ